MATIPPANPEYPAQPPMAAPPPPVKKKMGALGWVLMGCGGILVIGLIACIGLYFFVVHKAKEAGIDPDLLRSNPGLAAAKMVVAANPDLELISEDDNRGIIRVHDRKQNKNFIVNFEDAKKGKLTLQEEGQDAVTLSSSGSGANGSFEINSSQGTLKVGGGGPTNQPSWVPSYPNSQPQGVMSAEDANGKTAEFSFKTSDSVEKVVGFYKDALASNGLSVTNSGIFNATGSTSGIVAAQDSGKSRQVTLAVSNSTGETTVSLTWTEKK